MKIISIDPGYERVGIAVLEKNRGDRRETVLHSTCFKTSSKLPLTGRVFLIGKEIEETIKKFSPEALAIEKLYFENNAKTAMGVAEARGAILYVAKSFDLEIFEYTPLQIKSAVTGYGKATKDAIHTMVHKLVEVPKELKPARKSGGQDDEIDAIAVGITCFAYERF